MPSVDIALDGIAFDISARAVAYLEFEDTADAAFTRAVDAAVDGYDLAPTVSVTPVAGPSAVIRDGPAVACVVAEPDGMWTAYGTNGTAVRTGDDRTFDCDQLGG